MKLERLIGRTPAESTRRRTRALTSSLRTLTYVALFLSFGVAANAQVTLYRDLDFRGQSQTFGSAVADLSRTAVGNDSASSVDVAPGCVATLYRDANFRGRTYEVTRAIPDLRRTGMGNDRVSSIDVRCPDPSERSTVREDRPSDRGLHRGWDRGRRANRRDDDRHDDDSYDDDWYDDDWDERRRSRRWGTGRYEGSYGDDDRFARRDDRIERYEGVILFRDVDFRTPQIELYGPIAELDRTALGNDQLSSLSVPPGCSAILYEDEDFRGRSLEIRGDVADLRETPIGNDRVSSVDVHCR